MTTATASFAYSSTQAAPQQAAWINGVRDLLLAAGLVQTADTGQLVVTSGGTYVQLNGQNVYGYHMFVFPDALQASTPVFLRVSYQWAANYNGPQVKFTVGTGSDGAGNLTGPQYVGNTMTNASTYVTTAVSSYACYVDGTFGCMLGYNINNVGGLNNIHLASIVIDRIRNNSGVAQAGAVLVEGTSPNGTGASHRTLYGTNPPAQGSNIPALIPSMMATGSADGTSVNVFRHYAMSPTVKPSLGSLSYFFGEFTALTPITATVLGAPHTYLPMGRAMPGWSAAAALLSSNGSSAHDYDHCGMIRWE